MPMPEAHGRLADNIAFFARCLREAGLPVGPARVVEAVRAVMSAGLRTKADFYWTLHCVLVTRHEQSLLFHQIFELFWRRRALTDKLIAMMSPVAVPVQEKPKPAPGAQRASDAFHKPPQLQTRQEDQEDEVEFDARLTMTSHEILKTRDFAQMTADEIAQAKRQIARLRLHRDTMPARRLASGAGNRIDLRRTLRGAMKNGGDIVNVAWRGPGDKHPPIVALCDISGSMADYSRIFLHFLHAISEQGRRVHIFTFATRLTNITRALRARDVDEALCCAARSVRDWDGGTRIAECLERFNKDWSRRVLGQGATVLFISDGLERQVDERLPAAVDRLHRSCRHLVWLNPLLRFDAFEAKAAGIKAILPHVDEFRAIHNLQSMDDLVVALGRCNAAIFAPRQWLKQARREAS